MFVAEFMRPVIINGIEPKMTAPDLLDRVIPVRHKSIREKRRASTEVRSAFQKAYPALFGAVLDLVCEVMRVLPSVQVQSNRFRLQDFTAVGEAVARILGKEAGWFEDLYSEIIEEQSEAAQDDEYFITLLSGFFTYSKATKIRITSKMLLSDLREWARSEVDSRYLDYVPNLPSDLRQLLYTHVDGLERVGITFTKKNGEYTFEIDQDKADRDIEALLQKGSGVM